MALWFIPKVIDQFVLGPQLVEQVHPVSCFSTVEYTYHVSTVLGAWLLCMAVCISALSHCNVILSVLFE